MPWCKRTNPEVSGEDLNLFTKKWRFLQRKSLKLTPFGRRTTSLGLRGNKSFAFVVDLLPRFGQKGFLICASWLVRLEEIFILASLFYIFIWIGESLSRFLNVKISYVDIGNLIKASWWLSLSKPRDLKLILLLISFVLKQKKQKFKTGFFC